MPNFSLVDDGTFDTVIRCNLCGEEQRYNYDPSAPGADESELSGEEAYQAFIDDCMADAEMDHECEPEEE